MISTNRIASWLDGKDFPRLDTKQAEAFVQKQQRRPEALLAAYQASNERGVSSGSHDEVSHISQLRDLGADLVSRANGYRQTGNTASADKMLRAALQLGSQIDRTNSLTILENLVGIGIQQNALKAMNPSGAFEDSGRTVQAQIDRLSKRRDTLRTTARQFNKRLATMSADDIGTYFEAQKQAGEAAAQQLALQP